MFSICIKKYICEKMGFGFSLLAPGIYISAGNQSLKIAVFLLTTQNKMEP